jgi:hypothetical protein
VLSVGPGFGEEKNSYKVLIRKWKETGNLEDTDVDINVILK